MCIFFTVSLIKLRILARRQLCKCRISFIGMES